MVLERIARVGMDEDPVEGCQACSASADRIITLGDSRARSPINHQPGEEGAGLVWVEDVHLEHGHGVGAHRLIPEPVDAQL